MNLRNIPKEYHEALYLLDNEQSKQGLEVRPKYQNGELTIVIYKRFLGIPIKVDIGVEITDILHRVGMGIKKILGIGRNKIPCYHIGVNDTPDISVSVEVAGEEIINTDKKSRRNKK